MLLKMWLIDVTGGLPQVLGPYERWEDRRDAYFELRDVGREVYTLDTFKHGDARVGRHSREG